MNSWAAKQDDWYAQLLVADCYFKGDGVKLDYTEAVKWYELAATNSNEWNHAAAQLAQCYVEGLGVKKDLEIAAEWSEKAIVHIDSALLGAFGDDPDKRNPNFLFNASPF